MKTHVILLDDSMDGVSYKLPAVAVAVAVVAAAAAAAVVVVVAAVPGLAVPKVNYKNRNVNGKSILLAPCFFAGYGGYLPPLTRI